MSDGEHGQNAAIMAESGARLDYADLIDGSVRLANLLRARGFAPGDRVAIVMENNLAWFVTMWGVRRAGMMYVPVNWHLKPAEIRFVLENSDARALITSATLLDLAAEAARGLPAVVLKLAVGGKGQQFVDFAEALAGYPATAPEVEWDGGVMPYSAGTTGHPKGILRPLTGDRFGALNGLESLLRDLYRMDRTTAYLSPGPVYHSAPISFTAAVLALGGAVVLMSSFDAEGTLAAIERHRITHAQFVPTHFVRMLRLPAEVRNQYDLSSLRCVIHAAAPCAPDVKRAMIDWLGPIIHEYYAGSERAGFAGIDSAEWLRHPGSVGRSRTGAIHILDDDGTDLPPGEIGTIFFENAVPFRYHKDPAKTAGALNALGWGTLGDVGHVDGDGYLYIADRRSDLILSGGVNIYPQEIENVLGAHPAVLDVAVIGVPNTEFGQEVKAIVQLAPEVGEPAPAALAAFCREQLAGYKVPRSFEFVDSLPRLPNGKLQRRVLVERHREMIEGRGSGAGSRS